MPAEDLRELSGLPVADRAGHSLDRHGPREEQLRGPVHAGPLQLPAEAGAPDLGERALELASARGDLVGHPPQRQVGVGMAEPDHLDRFAVEVAPALHR